MTFSYLKTGFGCFLLLLMSACFYFTDPMRKAEKALGQEKCKQAKHFFLLAQSKKLKFARKAARICLPKFAEEAIWFYDYLSMREESPEKRLLIKEQLADIYLNKLKNYEKAIEVYSFLKSQSTSIDKKQLYSFRMALSYFEMGKWEMSLKEVGSLSFTQINNENLVRKLFLKARVLLMQERYTEAEKVFRRIQQVSPDYFRNNRLFLYLSFIYESQKEFHQAIMELENFQSTSEFLADKIRRLKVRQSKQPGIIHF